MSTKPSTQTPSEILSSKQFKLKRGQTLVEYVLVLALLTFFSAILAKGLKKIFYEGLNNLPKNMNKRDDVSNKKGQTMVEYILMTALVVGSLAVFKIGFAPTLKRVIGDQSSQMPKAVAGSKQMHLEYYRDASQKKN